MPAPSASTPFLPNLNQHVVLEPLEGPITEESLRNPTLFLIPRNPEPKFEAKTDEGKKPLNFEVMDWWVMHGMEAIVEFLNET